MALSPARIFVRFHATEHILRNDGSACSNDASGTGNILATISEPTPTSGTHLGHGLFAQVLRRAPEVRPQHRHADLLGRRIAIFSWPSHKVSQLPLHTEAHAHTRVGPVAHATKFPPTHAPLWRAFQRNGRARLLRPFGSNAVRRESTQQRPSLSDVANGSNAPHSGRYYGPVHASKADGVDGSRSRHQSAKVWKLSSNHEQREPPAMEITTIGLDLAKNVFQVHAIDARGRSCCPQGAAPRAGAAVLRSGSPVSGRHGGVRDEPLLGARDRASLAMRCG